MSEFYLSLLDSLVVESVFELGIRESRLVQCCRWCTVVLAISTYCSSALSNPTTEGSFERPGKIDNCLMSSVYTAAIPRAHRYPFGSLKYPLVRLSIPRMYGASGPVTTGCLSHSFPVRPPIQTTLKIPPSLHKC